MRKSSLFFGVILFCLPQIMNAQFPLMDREGNLVYFSPTYLQLAVGTNQLYAPDARLTIANGKALIRNNSGEASMLDFQSGYGGYSRFWQNEQSTELLADWSLHPADNNHAAWISMFRHSKTNAEKGLRFFRANSPNALEAQIGLGGAPSFVQRFEGNFGVGLSQPEEKLHIQGGALRLSTPGDPGRFVDLRTDGAALSLQSHNSALFLQGPRLLFGENGIPVMTIAPETGQVFIGAQPGAVSSEYLLAVNGKGVLEELLIKNSDAWPDYVFRPAYQRRSLEELHRFIRENGHLPGVPSADEVAKKGGVEVGEMQKILLEKIEEMSLYLIELKLENEALKERIAKLEQ